MGEVISARVPKALVRDIERIRNIEKTDRATVLRQLLAKAIADWKKEHSLNLYRDGKISLWRAARVAELSLREMMELAASRNIVFHYSEQDLEEDISAVTSAPKK